MAHSQRIAVIGAGLMGHGIALTFARAGHRVSVTDSANETLRTVFDRVAQSLKLLGATESEIAATLENIEICTSARSAVENAAFVFEAVLENLELKRLIFEDVENCAPEGSILASNTSVIPISEIMVNLESRHRALGTHWWNPPHMIPLVEVVKTTWTDLAKAQSMFNLLKDVGKRPVMVEKDVPGFIGNRLQHALWREAISLVENGICSAEAVDEVVKASFGRRLAVLGPLENADLVGLQLTRDIHEQVLYDLEASGKPSRYLDALLDRGQTGMAAGAGFRKWKQGDIDAVKTRLAEYLRKLESILPE